MSTSTATSARLSSSVIRSALAVPCPNVSSISPAILCLAAAGASGRRLFVLRVSRATLMMLDQRGDLVPDTDRRAADQLPGTGGPDQETDHDQDRDRVHVPGVARMGDHVRSRDQPYDR